MMTSEQQPITPPKNVFQKVVVIIQTVYVFLIALIFIGSFTMYGGGPTTLGVAFVTLIVQIVILRDIVHNNQRKWRITIAYFIMMGLILVLPDIEDSPHKLYIAIFMALFFPSLIGMAVVDYRRDKNLSKAKDWDG